MIQTTLPTTAAPADGRRAATARPGPADGAFDATLGLELARARTADVRRDRPEPTADDRSTDRGRPEADRARDRAAERRRDADRPSRGAEGDDRVANHDRTREARPGDADGAEEIDGAGETDADDGAQAAAAAAATAVPTRAPGAVVVSGEARDASAATPGAGRAADAATGPATDAVTGADAGEGALVDVVDEGILEEEAIDAEGVGEVEVGTTTVDDASPTADGATDADPTDAAPAGADAAEAEAPELVPTSSGGAGSGRSEDGDEAPAAPAPARSDAAAAVDGADAEAPRPAPAPATTETEAPAPTTPLAAPGATAASSAAGAGEVSSSRPVPVTDQLVTQVRPLLSGPDGSHEIDMELHPAELGRVQLKVTLEDGVVSIRIQADDPGSRRLLAQQLGQLREALEGAGVRAGSLDVGAGGRDGHGTPAHDERGASGRAHLPGGDGPEPAHGPRPRTDRDAALDVLL